VLVSGRNGRPARDFSGRLSFAWPTGCEPGAAELFPFGFGGSYASAPTGPAHPTVCALSQSDGSDGLAIYARGLQPGIGAFAGDTGLVNLAGSGPAFRASAFDVAAQEDARRLVWTGPASLQFRWPVRTFAPQGALSVRYQLDVAPAAPLRLKALGAATAINLRPTLTRGAGKGWQTMEVPLACLGTVDLPGIELASEGAITLDVTTIRIVPQAADTACDGPF
jgi:beta-glucosidase